VEEMKTYHGDTETQRKSRSRRRFAQISADPGETTEMKSISDQRSSAFICGNSFCSLLFITAVELS
jgi:hypothetical protein